MAIQKVRCTIQGTSALLMHAYPMDGDGDVPAKNQTPEEQAERGAYRDPDTGELYIPGVAIQRCLVGAAAYSKGKGRASLQKPVAACVLVSPERVSLGATKYRIDSRPVVIPATKGRVVRHRPRLDNWEVTFTVEYDPALLTEKELRTVVDDAGSRVGLLEFRPEKKGPFGRFMVTSWES
jgi:hypothetical protein